MKNLNRSRALAARRLAAALLFTTTVSSFSATHYVDVNSTNATPPYANWATAATNIQDAVDAAVAGDEIVVTNGVYFKGTGSSLYGLVTVRKALSLRSVNGPQVTIIANNSMGFIRCVSLGNYASLCGFTLTGGRWPGAGGGLNSYPYGYASNCIIAGCRAYGGGGAFGGTLSNCTLSNNVAGPMRTGYTNAAYDGGGASACQLINCVLVGNSAGDTPGDGIGFGGGAYGCSLYNCTLIGNSAGLNYNGPFGYGGGVSGCTVLDCILYYNSAASSAVDVDDSSYPCFLTNCCTPGLRGDGNFGLPPLFVDTNGWANLRLQSNSPCINAGNNAYAPAGPDLDGNPRIVGGTVDIGAYEYQSLSMLNFSIVSNQAGFNITGQSNQVVTVETSADLVNWSPLATNTLSGHPFPFTDPAPANLPRRFYRGQAQ